MATIATLSCNCTVRYPIGAPKRGDLVLCARHRHATITTVKTDSPQCPVCQQPISRPGSRHRHCKGGRSHL